MLPQKKKRRRPQLLSSEALRAIDRQHPGEQEDALLYPRLTLYSVAGTAIVAPERSSTTAVESSPPSNPWLRRLPSATTLPDRLAPLRQLTTSRSLLLASSAGQGLTLCRVTWKSCFAAEPREKSFIFFLVKLSISPGASEERERKRKVKKRRCRR